MNTIDMEAVANRYPHLVTEPLAKRLRMPLIALCGLLYFAFAYWFFAIGAVFTNGNWTIAGSYLADWVSYEERPDIKIRPDGYMTVTFPNNSGLGADPKPEWLKKDESSITRTETVLDTTAPTAEKPKSAFNFMAPTVSGEENPGTAATPQTHEITETVVSRALVEFSSSTSIEVTRTLAIVKHGGQTMEVPLMGTGPLAATQPLPGWANQPNAGKKIILSFGLPGWAEIDTDRVRIRKRFLGWDNFLFDTNSLFFEKSASEVVSLILSDERLDPKMSNFARAADDILYNPSWQHLDVWTKLLQTIVMAFVGTVLAVLIAFPLSFLAARNITRNRLANQALKRLFDFLRSVDMLIWALFFTRAFGPGPLAGISAIFFTDTGTFGKLYAEALENIDNKPREGVASVGAPPITVQRFGVLPQVLPVFASQALYFWESNTRSATIIGAVGAGGIGLKLWEAMRTNSDWENVAYMVVLILIVVYLFDTISNALRSRLMGTASR
jgi:phosphonate transport system permease protein